MSTFFDCTSTQRICVVPNRRFLNRLAAKSHERAVWVLASNSLHQQHSVALRETRPCGVNQLVSTGDNMNQVPLSPRSVPPPPPGVPYYPLPEDCLYCKHSNIGTKTQLAIAFISHFASQNKIYPPRQLKLTCSNHSELMCVLENQFRNQISGHRYTDNSNK